MPATINVSTGAASFQVSDTDLGESATLSGKATWSGGSAGSIANLNSRGTAEDESHAAGNGSLEFNTGAGVGFEPNNSNHVIFAFDLTNASRGYDISEIATFASWGGRARQEYKIEGLTVNNTVVSVLPQQVLADGNGYDASKVDITNLGLTNIKQLTFSGFGYSYGGAGAGAGNIYHEIDVFGTASAVPEPGTMVLVLIGLFGLLAYAWRKRM